MGGWGTYAARFATTTTPHPHPDLFASLEGSAYSWDKPLPIGCAELDLGRLHPASTLAPPRTSTRSYRGPRISGPSHGVRHTGSVGRFCKLIQRYADSRVPWIYGWVVLHVPRVRPAFEWSFKMKPMPFSAERLRAVTRRRHVAFYPVNYIAVRSLTHCRTVEGAGIGLCARLLF